MKRLGYSIGIVLLKTGMVWAQETALIKVKAGDDIQTAVAFTDKYRFPTFMDGTVLFLNGTSTPAKLNYYTLVGEMHFLSPSKDTLSLANEHTIKWIKVGETPFFYSQDYGYLEVTADYPSVKLGKRQIFRVAGLEKIAAYQQSSSVSSIKNYSILATGNSSVKKLEAKGDVVLSKEKTYYFIDQNNRFYKATKSGILKIFVKNKKQIENYLSEKSIDFTNEEDLKKLLQFCSQLS